MSINSNVKNLNSKFEFISKIIGKKQKIFYQLKQTFSRISNQLIVIFLISFATIISLSLFFVIPQNNLQTVDLKKNKNFENAYNRYKWPEPSYSLMGKFQKAAITCDHGMCSEIGRNILLKGGNAVDSAIAALICLGVTNPQSSGIGGGLIMTFYNRTSKMCKVIDARETAPIFSKTNMFGFNESASKYGYRAIATPGELAGYWLAFNKFGSKNVKWTELFLPSIKLAENGIPVSEYLSQVLSIKEKQFMLEPSMNEWINKKTNRVYQFGDIIKRKKLAKTLRHIAYSKNPVKLFYKGKMADVIINEIQKNGGILTKQDLFQYKPKLYENPLVSELPLNGFNNFNQSEKLFMCGPPPPSSFVVTQTIINIMIARFSDHDREGNAMNRTTVLNDTEFYHWFIEAQKLAYAYRTQLADTNFVPEAFKLAKNMTTISFLKKIYKRIPKIAQKIFYYSDKKLYQKEDYGTSHVSVIDSEENGVSVTSTINRWFGATVQSDKLGIIWNDEMDDFSTPGLKNGFGFSPSKVNYIQPKKRPMSSMSPMILFNNNGKLKFVIGASGGSKIISAIAKPVIRVLCFNETIKEAIDAPTLHNQYTPEETQFEKTVPQQLLKDLKNKFAQKLKPSTGFEGVVQGIHINNDGFIYANGDYRRKTNMHPDGY